jgi:hypothetical protein
MGLNQLKYTRATKVAEAVGSLLQQIDATTLRDIVVRGEDEFISHAATHWKGHGFHRTDLQQAFEMLRGRASTLPPEQLIGPH